MTLRWLTWRTAYGWSPKYNSRVHATLDGRRTLCGHDIHPASAKADELRPRCQQCVRRAITRGLL